MSISKKITQLKRDFVDVKQAGYNEGYEDGISQGGDTTDAYNQGVNAGKQAERRAFWEQYQNRWMDSYFWAFSNNSFSDDTYYPIKPIVCGNGLETSVSIFRENRLLTDTKVEIQTSCPSMKYCFLHATKLVTIRKITALETTVFDSAFTACLALKHIDFGSKIGQSISFKDSPYLTTGKDGEVLDGEPSNSVQNIIDHLADLTGKTKQTLTLNTQVKVSEEQVAKINSLNWSLSQI